MSHNIHNEKFITRRQPAWHGLGLVIQDDIAAVDAGERLGIPIVFTRPISTDSGIEIPGYKCILGKEKDKAPVPFSVVTEDYNEITHADFLIAWDRATKKAPIETIGLLGRGENLFVTTKLPKFDVKGDELDTYLLAANILSGKEADFGRVTNVRVVCQNTLLASASNFKEEFRVCHLSDSIKQIEEWIRKVWLSSSLKAQALKEAYTILANYTPNGVAVQETLRTSYPSIPQPEADAHTSEGLDRLAAWQRAQARQEKHRDSVLELFEGKAVGSDLRSARGTAWGLYNAVVEYEDYVKPRRSTSSAVFGAGADRKEAAFTELLTLAAR